MIQVAFCDDDILVLNELCSLLERYCADRNEEIRYMKFRSPLELLCKIEHGVRFDILFLDVLMPGENGIDTAAEIRAQDSNMKIIFLTSSDEFAVQSYTVGAYFYQLKPIQKKDFYRLMDSVLDTCEKEQAASILLHCKGGVNRILLHQLEYCEINHRTLLFHLVDGSVFECIGSMDDLSRRLLPFGGFLRVHRSYIVNLKYIQALSYKVITMNCQAQIPIPRGKYKEIKNAFLEYAFANEQVMA